MVIKKNILVTGSNGQLGSCLKKISTEYDHYYFFKRKSDLDITNYSAFKDFLVEKNINTVINCAAYTDVNGAEINKKLSNLINNQAIEYIAKSCSELDLQLIHISTDYVFDGNKTYPYVEVDKTSPINHYGLTKLKGENKILSYNLNNSVIIRTSWLYSHTNNNFVSRILYRLKNKKEIFVVDNEIGSPTNAIDLAYTIMKIIPKLKNNKTKIYHFANFGFCSRYELAKKIKELIKEDCMVIPAKNNSKYSIRPKFSALDSTQIFKDFQISLKSWESSLKTHLDNYILNSQYEF